MDIKLQEAKPHTIKKFEIINNYVDGWARKILGYNGNKNTTGSKGIIYIDCMSNAGMYVNDKGEEIKGTAIRIAETIQTIIKDYPDKKAILFFNDNDRKKVDALKYYMEKYEQTDSDQVTYVCYCDDRDNFLDLIAPIIKQKYFGYNTLLLYDPYDAAVDWDAITPFINRWGEVIINHMVSDTTRGAKQAKKPLVKKKYQDTYQQDIDKIISIGTDRTKLENIFEDIIKNRANGNYETYIAAFPFFNSKNGLVYNLLFCTHNVEGIKLFKKVAWNAFGGKSSMKKTHGNENQMVLDLETCRAVEAGADENCYYIKDVVKYIYDKYKNCEKLSMQTVYDDLDVHPVFPSDGYKREIKKELKERYNAKITRENLVIFQGE